VGFVGEDRALRQKPVAKGVLGRPNQAVHAPWSEGKGSVGSGGKNSSQR
jgi:hypothetical protein